jgi:hypothetical protein
MLAASANVDKRISMAAAEESLSRLFSLVSQVEGDGATEKTTALGPGRRDAAVGLEKAKGIPKLTDCAS